MPEARKTSRRSRGSRGSRALLSAETFVFFGLNEGAVASTSQNLNGHVKIAGPQDMLVFSFWDLLKPRREAGSDLGLIGPDIGNKGWFGAAFREGWQEFDPKGPLRMFLGSKRHRPWSQLSVDVLFCFCELFFVFRGTTHLPFRPARRKPAMLRVMKPRGVSGRSPLSYGSYCGWTKSCTT